MAREAEDREDLLADATAYVRRIELAVAGHDDALFVGFRSIGCPSFYFGPNCVYHFNTDGQLRRAFANDSLYKATKGNLARLQRRREQGEVVMARHDLTPNELESFVQEIESRLEDVRRAISDGKYEIVGQVPDGEDIVQQAAEWIDGVRRPLQVAQSAGVK